MHRQGVLHRLTTPSIIIEEIFNVTRFKDHEPQLQKYGQKRASDAKKRDKKSRQQVTDQGSHGIVIAFEQDYPPISNMVSLQPQEGWDQSTKISCTSLKTCVSLILAVALAMHEDEPQTQTTEAQDNSTATSPTNTVQVEQATTTSISPSPLLGSNSDFALPNYSDLSPTAISYGMDYHPEMIAGGPKSHGARLCRRKLHKHLDRIRIPETVADQEHYAAPSEGISDFLPAMHTTLYQDSDSVYSAQESIAEYARQEITPTESENDTSTSKKNPKSASEMANGSAQEPSMVVKQKYDPSQDGPILCPETVSSEDFWQTVADNMSYKGELAAVIAHTFPLNLFDLRSVGLRMFYIPNANEIFQDRKDQLLLQNVVKQQEQMLPNWQQELEELEQQIQQQKQKLQLEQFKDLCREQRALKTLENRQQRLLGKQKRNVFFKEKLSSSMAEYDCLYVIEELYKHGFVLPHNYIEFFELYESAAQALKFKEQRYVITRPLNVDKETGEVLRNLKGINDDIFNKALPFLVQWYKEATKEDAFYFLQCAEKSFGSLEQLRRVMYQLFKVFVPFKQQSSDPNSDEQSALSTQKSTAHQAATDSAKSKKTSLTNADQGKLQVIVDQIQELLASIDNIVPDGSELDKLLAAIYQDDKEAKKKKQKQARAQKKNSKGATASSAPSATTTANSIPQATENSSVAQSCSASKDYKPCSQKDASVAQVEQNYWQAAQKVEKILEQFESGVASVADIKATVACYDLEMEASFSVFADKASSCKEALVNLIQTKKTSDSEEQSSTSSAASAALNAEVLTVLSKLAEDCFNTHQRLQAWKNAGAHKKVDSLKEYFDLVLKDYGVDDSKLNPKLYELAKSLYDKHNQLLSQASVYHIVCKTAAYYVKCLNQPSHPMPHTHHKDGDGIVIESRCNKKGDSAGFFDEDTKIINIGRGRDGYAKAKAEQAKSLKDNKSNNYRNSSAVVDSTSDAKKNVHYRLQIPVHISKDDYYFHEAKRSNTKFFRILVEKSTNPKHQETDLFKIQLIKEGVPPLTKGKLDCLRALDVDIYDYYSVKRWRNAVVGCDAGPRNWVAISDIGFVAAELFPNEAKLYKKLGKEQQKLDAIQRKLNPNKYHENGEAKSREESPEPWNTDDAEYQKQLQRVRNAYHKIACARKQSHQRLANLLFALGGDFRIENMLWKALGKRRKNNTQNKDTKAGTADKAATVSITTPTIGASYGLNKDSASVADAANAKKSKSGDKNCVTVTTANKAVAKSKEQSQKSDAKRYKHYYPEQLEVQPARELDDELNSPSGVSRNSIVHRMSCSKLEALIASNCTFHGHGKNLVNQWKLSTSQWFVDKQGKLYKQKIELSERYHCSHDGLWLQRDILAAFLLQHTKRSEKAQESHKKLHKSWKIQAKGKNAQAKLDLFDLEAIKRDLPELIVINQIACDYILKNGSTHLRASFKLPRSKAAQKKLQQRFMLPEQNLRIMHVQEINMTNMQSPVIRGSKELGHGYALKSASFSTLCEFECRYS